MQTPERKRKRKAAKAVTRDEAERRAALLYADRATAISYMADAIMRERVEVRR